MTYISSILLIKPSIELSLPVASPHFTASLTSPLQPRSHISCLFGIIFQMNNSPIRNSTSLFFGDQSDNFANKYLAEYSHSRSNHYSGELIKEQLQSEIQTINTALCSLLPDRLKLGDFFSSDLREVEKTLEVIKVFLTQRQRDLETKNEIYANNRKVDSEKAQLGAQVEKMQKEIKRLETERDNLTLKLKSADKSYKESLEKITQEKDDYLKRYKAIEARENQYKNENRKLQTTIKSLQDKINKGQDKSGFRNGFEVMQQLQTYGPTIIMMNAEHEYNQIVAKTMQENYLQICKENQYYKDCLQSIQKELQTVLDIKRQVLRRRRGYDSEYDSTFDLKNFKTELLNLPYQFSKEGINNLQENVAKFKEAMKIGQSLDDRESDQKINCVSNVKNLIRNYKNVVESQEQLLNRVILKAKEFKSNEIQAIENRYSKGMDEDEIERARKFLQQQSNYLDGKNRELEMTRKAMQSTIRKVEQEREQFSKRSTQASEDVAKIRKQVQLLPALIEQQLNVI